MAFSSTPTYSELQTGVANWLKRADLTSYIPDLILMGEKYIFRKARTRDMEAALSSTIASGVIAVPNDYVALKYAYIDGAVTTRVHRKPADWIYTQYPTRSADGLPQFIAREGSNFIFGPYPDSAYTVKGLYYKRLTSVQSSANALFTNNPDLYLFAALAEAVAFMKDDARVALWSAKRDQILNDLNGEDVAEGAAGGPLTMAVA